MDRSAGVLQRRLQAGPPLGERRVHERFVVDREQIEGDERRRRLFSEQVDSEAAGWMRC